MNFHDSDASSLTTYSQLCALFTGEHLCREAVTELTLDKKKFVKTLNRSLCQKTGHSGNARVLHGKRNYGNRYSGIDQRQELASLFTCSSSVVFFLFLSRFPSFPRLYLRSRSVFLDRFTRASQRQLAWISRSVDTGQPPACRRRPCHSRRSTQKGRAALYTLSIYLRQIQWKLGSRTVTITDVRPPPISLFLSLQPFFLSN